MNDACTGLPPCATQSTQICPSAQDAVPPGAAARRHWAAREILAGHEEEGLAATCLHEPRIEWGGLKVWGNSATLSSPQVSLVQVSSFRGVPLSRWNGLDPLLGMKTLLVGGEGLVVKSNTADRIASRGNGTRAWSRQTVEMGCKSPGGLGGVGQAHLPGPAKRASAPVDRKGHEGHGGHGGQGSTRVSMYVLRAQRPAHRRSASRPYRVRTLSPRRG